MLFVGKVADNRKFHVSLQDQGYEVRSAEGLRATLKALADFEPQCLIVDMANASEQTVSRITRSGSRRDDKPFILLLTNHRTIPDDIVYDDFLVRPFTANKLGSKVAALLESRAGFVLRLGPITLDRRTQQVQTPNGECQLTPKQYELLDFFFQHPGEIVTRKQLMEQVWKTSYLGDTRTLDVHIRWLRECVEKDASNPVLIRTHRGQGYSLEIEGPVETVG
ncbi:MAG: response regulator transcription factor [Caldilineales bacterium]|nr:response regulator transcription factor [Caldilineales bacterium]